MTVGDLGEFGLIAAIAARLPQGGRTVIGIGDDAAVVATPDGDWIHEHLKNYRLG